MQSRKWSCFVSSSFAMSFYAILGSKRAVFLESMPQKGRLLRILLVLWYDNQKQLVVLKNVW